MNVQHRLADEPESAGEYPESAGEYKAVVCQACTKLHFIHSSSGKLLGDKEEKQTPLRYGAAAASATIPSGFPSGQIGAKLIATSDRNS